MTKFGNSNAKKRKFYNILFLSNLLLFTVFYDTMNNIRTQTGGADTVAAFTDTEFRAIFEAHYNKLFRLCLARTGGNENDAHKITLLVFETLWENREHIPDREDWGGWLYKTTIYKLSEYYRAKKKEQPYLDAFRYTAEESAIPDIPECDSPLPSDILIYKDAILAALSDTERTLYTAVFEKQEKYKDIAITFGTSEGAIKMRVKRLRAKLEQYVRKLHL